MNPSTRLPSRTLTWLVAALALGAACSRSSSPRTERGARSRLTVLPASTCTLTGSVRTCELWARPGSLTLPDASTVTIWGYADGAAAPATVPGPALIANEGETLEIILHNDLAQPTALLAKGQPQPPDLEGVAPAAQKTYSFPALAPGTFLYEAGPIPGAEHQVPMGLYGAIVVRPAAAPTTQAYADVATTYEDEALVVLSEIDPALHGSADPSQFDLRGYAPSYRLINGKGYPETAPTATAAGSRVLLRYVNAGVQHHAMGVLGAHQQVIATDGAPRAYPYRVVSETIPPGQSIDAIVTIPATAAAGSRFAVHDASMMLHNAGSSSFGGMLAFLEVGVAAPGADTAGPVTSGIALTPDPSTGSADVAIAATVSDASTGGANVAAAEWSLDAPAAAGTGTAMTGSFGAPTASVAGAIPAATLAALAAGPHVLFVRGQDDLGNWGSVNFAVLTLDNAGPTTSGLAVAPTPTNGTSALAITGTADDRAAGGSDIFAAEYFFDAAGAPGAGTAMTVNLAAPIASVDAAAAPAALSGLAEGPHAVVVRSQDALGNWGPTASVAFTVDRTGPATSGIAIAPNPTDGTSGVNSTVPAIRVTATLSDALAGVAAAEGFIDTAGANGTGFPFVARRGAFGAPSLSAFGDIPLTTIAQLADGSHAIQVHGRDTAGNWGPTASAALVIDRAAPVVSNLQAAPNPTNGPGGTATAFTITATATDATTNVVRAEWFDGADPGAGSGTPIPVLAPATSVALSTSIDFVALGWTAGNHTISVRARDAANHWSAAVSVVVSVVLPNTLPNVIFADGFESGNTSMWSGGGAGAISVTNAAALAGTFGLAASLAGAGGQVTDLTPAAEPTYHARFWFDPNGAVTGATPVGLMQATDGAGQVFVVQFLHATATGPFQVRVLFARAGGSTATRYYDLTDAPHAIEIGWAASTNAALSLRTDGTPRQTLVLDTSARRIDSAQLGAFGMGPGASGTVFLDAFASTRVSIIGP